MAGPARKREAVGHLQRTVKMSEGRACKVVKQPRSTQRYAVKGDADEARLREELRENSRRRPRAGYRMAARCLRRCGWRVNCKRLQRLWCEVSLKVVQKAGKCARLGGSEQGSQRLRAGRANEVWSCDFVQDRTRDGRWLKMLCVVDESTRECLAIHEARQIRAEGRDRGDGGLDAWAWHAWASAGRQRARVHRPGPRGMAGTATGAYAVHRPWEPLGERLL